MSLVEKALKKLQDAKREAGTGHDTPRRIGAEPAPESSEVAKIAAAIPMPLRSEPAAPVAAVRSSKYVTIDIGALRAAGLLAVEDQERRVASEYRQIKRPLIAGALGRGIPAVPNGRVIMVASALPGEGKTFTSVNLAFNMALEKDTNVLLVDADLPKPHVSGVFGVGKEPGLLDALLDESRDVESLIIPTSVRGLSILPAGRPDANATELLASDRMRRLVASLVAADPRRIVLCDSPPLLLTTESRVLATAVGQVVIVVRAESTTHQAVVDALACIPEGKSVGLVLNQCRTAPAHEYYGYGEYGYNGRAAE